jgi:hypothetical protein
MAAQSLEGAIPSTSAQWKAFGIGVAIGGAVGVGNLLQKSPLGGAS